jgi:hypothetical protein
LKESGKGTSILVGRRVGGDKFRAGVEEKLFKSAECLLSIGAGVK